MKQPHQDPSSNMAMEDPLQWMNSCNPAGPIRSMGRLDVPYHRTLVVLELHLYINTSVYNLSIDYLIDIPKSTTHILC